MSEINKLALEGGIPVTTQKLHGWPVFEKDEIAAVAQVLESGKVNYWTGDECKQFEAEFAEFINCKHAISLANGTLALELALYAFGIQPHDEVIVTPKTFIASTSAALLRGMRPVFADIDLDSQNITAETIQAVLTPRTKAIIPVHLGGHPCDMDPIMQLAQKHNLIVIEDCAQVLGGKYKGRPVGSLGHAAAFSFCQDKIMTTGGEGGMLTLNDTDVWKKAWAYKDHGKSYDTVHGPKKGFGFRWLHESVGTNWRMTEMQAAIGRIALKKVPGWVEKRRKNLVELRRVLSEFKVIRLPQIEDSVEHAAYRCYAFICSEYLKEGWSREKILTAIMAEGIPCFEGSCSEIYLEKAFDKNGRPEKRLKNAQRLTETSLAFLIHPTLTEEDIDLMKKAIVKVLKAAQKNE